MKQHTCYFCGHVGTDVIPAEYYDKDLCRDVFDGWACKDIEACLDRQYAEQIKAGTMKSREIKSEAICC